MHGARTPILPLCLACTAEGQQWQYTVRELAPTVIFLETDALEGLTLPYRLHTGSHGLCCKKCNLFACSPQTTYRNSVMLPLQPGGLALTMAGTGLGNPPVLLRRPSTSFSSAAIFACPAYCSSSALRRVSPTMHSTQEHIEGIIWIWSPLLAWTKPKTCQLHEYWIHPSRVLREDEGTIQEVTSGSAA